MSAKEIADRWTEMAVNLYQADRHLQPVLGLIGDEPFVLGLSSRATENIQSSLAEIISVLSVCLDRNPEYVVTVSEGWSKTVAHDEDEKPNREQYPRHQLAREAAEGVPGVETVLSIVCFNSTFPELSHGVMIKAATMERNDFPGEQNGGIADHVYLALKMANEARADRPDFVTVKNALSALTPLLDSALVGE